MRLCDRVTRDRGMRASRRAKRDVVRPSELWRVLFTRYPVLRPCDGGTVGLCDLWPRDSRPSTVFMYDDVACDCENCEKWRTTVGRATCDMRPTIGIQYNINKWQSAIALG